MHKDFESHKIEHTLQELLKETQRTNGLLRELVKLTIHRPTHLYFKFQGATMPATIAVGQSISTIISESNPSGPVPVVGANIQYACSDTGIASFVNNGDGTATFTGVAATDSATPSGIVTVTCTDTVNNLSFTDTLTVTAGAGTGVPTALSFTWGAPQGVAAFVKRP